MTQTAQQASGQWGEAAAEHLLTKSGLKLLTRNYRCRAGEIDLIMLDPDTEDGEVVVFVEVRLRAGGAMVEAMETVDQHKQRRLSQAAQHFLMNKPVYANRACRFDVVAINDPASKPVWLRNAFDASGW